MDVASKVLTKLLIVILLLLMPRQMPCQTKFIHVLVALCDNEHQGIVPVPNQIGNGQKSADNLYWGCRFGVKTFLKKQSDWKLIKLLNNPSKQIVERLIFKHKSSQVFLVADAYNGAMIKQTIVDFLNFSAGLNPLELNIDSAKIDAGGKADLICYVGHNGLMDFSLDDSPFQADQKRREVIVLACASKNYFYDYVKKTGAYPFLWTTNLLCPEAYTLISAIDSWIKNNPSETTREKAAQAYSRYQRCGIHAARNLLVTGY